MKHLRLALLTTCLLISGPAFSQNENAQTNERIDRLERDLQLMQRQIARGEPVTPAAPISEADIAANGGASLEVRLSTLEDQIRSLNGKLEESQHQNQVLSDKLDKMQKDYEFRFSELSQNGAKPAATPAAETGEKNAKLIKPEEGKKGEETPAPSGPTSAGDGVLRLPEGNPKDSNFTTPREHYNYAFRLLNQTQYEAAAQAFDSFTKKYPKDPLVGNAFYWEGETHYIRRDYVNAADDFRQGFEALPNGPKAADNLLKLSMSLDALNRDKEACVVLQQIVTKFKASSTSVTDKASQEQKRIGCK